jgi:IS30 family transposase
MLIEPPGDRSRANLSPTLRCAIMFKSGLLERSKAKAASALRGQRSNGRGAVLCIDRAGAGPHPGALSRLRVVCDWISPRIQPSISHEAIYQALYIQGRGALRRELSACLRSARALRMPRERARNRGKSFIDDEIMISELPPEVADRAVPGHWEGDLMLGLQSSAIGTLVERTTRFEMLLHLPRMEGFQSGKGIKNGPAFAGHGAQAVRSAIASSMKSFPKHLRRSLTWDQGAEMAQHAALIDTGLQIYFCDPQSPWQRRTNENANGLLRQYFPKGTDLSQHTADELDAVAHALNTRPRKTLGWKTPAEALDELLKIANMSGVTSTG